MLRMIIGDCQRRIEFDEIRLSFGMTSTIDTMFYEKRYYKDIGGEDLISPLHKEWWMLKE